MYFRFSLGEFLTTQLVSEDVNSHGLYLRSMPKFEVRANFKVSR